MDTLFQESDLAEVAEAHQTILLEYRRQEQALNGLRLPHQAASWDWNIDVDDLWGMGV